MAVNSNILEQLNALPSIKRKKTNSVNVAFGNYNLQEESIGYEILYILLH